MKYAILLAIVLSFGLSACNKGGEAPPAAPAESAPAAAPETNAPASPAPEQNAAPEEKSAPENGEASPKENSDAPSN